MATPSKTVDAHDGSADELRDALAMAARTEMNDDAASALATTVIGVNCLEANISMNPEAAKLVGSLGNRLLSIAQRMGQPLVPPGVGERSGEGLLLFDTDGHEE